MTKEILVRAKSLCKKFDEKIAVDNINFEISSGDVIGFLGPNGAGKTTTIRMLLNILNPSSGELTLFGHTFDRHRSEILCQMNASSGTLTLPGKLSPKENLQIFSDMYGLKNPQKRIAELIEKFNLTELSHKPVYSLSTGQQVRASLAKAFLNRPKLLLLDEPTSSLDPDVADRVRKIIVDVVRDEGTTVFLTSHNMAEVEEVCTRVLFLNEGKIQAEGTPQELAERITRWTLALKLKNEGEKRLELGRSEVGPYLTSVVREGKEIENISIHEPTLEDFFVHSARQTSIPSLHQQSEKNHDE